jgi:hypothetical protein
LFGGRHYFDVRGRARRSIPNVGLPLHHCFHYQGNKTNAFATTIPLCHVPYAGSECAIVHIFATVVGDSPVAAPVTAPAPAPIAAEVAMKARPGDNHAGPSIVEMPFRKSAVDFRYSIEISNLRIVAYFSKLGNDVTSLATASSLAMQYQVLANAFCLVCGIARAAGPVIGFEFEYVHKF